MNHFPYAKPPQFHYQTFNRHTLQFTNHPVFDSPPRPPTPAIVEPTDEEAAAPTKPLGGEENAKDEPNKEVQDAEPSTSAEGPEIDAGLTILEMPIAVVLG